MKRPRRLTRPTTIRQGFCPIKSHNTWIHDGRCVTCGMSHSDDDRAVRKAHKPKQGRNNQTTTP